MAVANRAIGRSQTNFGAIWVDTGCDVERSGVEKFRDGRIVPEVRQDLMDDDQRRRRRHHFFAMIVGINVEGGFVAVGPGRAVGYCDNPDIAALVTCPDRCHGRQPGVCGNEDAKDRGELLVGAIPIAVEGDALIDARIQSLRVHSVRCPFVDECPASTSFALPQERSPDPADTTETIGRTPVNFRIMKDSFDC